MERTKGKKEENGAILWKKSGRGSFRLFSGKIIKPNQTFHASLDEIPLPFRDVIIPVKELPSEEIIVPLKTLPPRYVIKEKGEKFVIEDSRGKSINEGLLSKEKAERFIEELST